MLDYLSTHPISSLAKTRMDGNLAYLLNLPMNPTHIGRPHQTTLPIRSNALDQRHLTCLLPHPHPLQPPTPQKKLFVDMGTFNMNPSGTRSYGLTAIAQHQ